MLAIKNFYNPGTIRNANNRSGSIIAKKTPQTMYSQSLLLSIRRLQLKLSLRTVC
jgi:hypothetical protein